MKLLGIKKLNEMRNLENTVNKLNDLLATNNELEKIYAETSNGVSSPALKDFFKERRNERKEFGDQLQKQILKLGAEPNDSLRIKQVFTKVERNFNKLISLQDEAGLKNEVCNIQQLTINKYNMVLTELNLPLSVCKLLAGQRDDVQESINTIRRSEILLEEIA